MGLCALAGSLPVIVQLPYQKTHDQGNPQDEKEDPEAEQNLIT
jgi:hypothetical protein